jgi:hypothetical protein
MRISHSPDLIAIGCDVGCRISRRSMLLAVLGRGRVSLAGQNAPYIATFVNNLAIFIGISVFLKDDRFLANRTGNFWIFGTHCDTFWEGRRRFAKKFNPECWLAHFFLYGQWRYLSVRQRTLNAMLRLSLESILRSPLYPGTIHERWSYEDLKDAPCPSNWVPSDSCLGTGSAPVDPIGSETSGASILLAVII